jgi:hypothetical protein
MHSKLETLTKERDRLLVIPPTQDLQASLSTVASPFKQSLEFVEFTKSPSSLHLPVDNTLSFKQKELQIKIEQLTQLLTESEGTVQKLMEQEKFLKEQLRSEDRMELRQNLNIEYLKNVILSFFGAGSKEQLLPVLTKVLELSPEEERQLKKAIGGNSSLFGLF